MVRSRIILKLRLRHVVIVVDLGLSILLENIPLSGENKSGGWESSHNLNFSTVSFNLRHLQMLIACIRNHIDT